MQRAGERESREAGKGTAFACRAKAAHPYAMPTASCRPPPQLSAAGSYDPDSPGAPLDQFIWWCTNGGANCTTTSGHLLDLRVSTEATLTIPAGTLAASSLLQFHAFASKDTRSAAAATTIEVVAGNPPSVGITASLGGGGGAIRSAGSLIMNPSAKLVLQGVASSVQPRCGQLVAGQTGAACAGNFEWASVSSRALDLASVRASPLGLPSLVIKPDRSAVRLAPAPHRWPRGSTHR